MTKQIELDEQEIETIVTVVSGFIGTLKQQRKLMKKNPKLKELNDNCVRIVDKMKTEISVESGL